MSQNEKFCCSPHYGAMTYNKEDTRIERNEYMYDIARQTAVYDEYSKRVEAREARERMKINECSRCNEPAVTGIYKTSLTCEWDVKWDGRLLCAKCMEEISQCELAIVHFMQVAGLEIKNQHAEDVKSRQNTEVKIAELERQRMKSIEELEELERQVDRNSEKAERLLKIAEEVAKKANIVQKDEAKSMKDVIMESAASGDLSRLAMVAKKKQRLDAEMAHRASVVSNDELNVQITLNARYRAKLIHDVLQILNNGEETWSEEDLINMAVYEGMCLFNEMINCVIEVYGRIAKNKELKSNQEIIAEFEKVWNEIYQRKLANIPSFKLDGEVE